MKIRNMCWGYDREGVAKDQPEGNSIVELVVTDTDRHNYCVTEMRCGEIERVVVSEVPFFEIFMECSHPDVDKDYELDKMRHLAKEIYEFKLHEAPDEMFKSRFEAAIRLVRFAMCVCHEMKGPTDVTAKKFIEPYLNKYTRDIKIPDGFYYE